MMFFMTINTLLLMIRMFLFYFDHNELKSVEKDKHYTSTLIHLYTVIGQSCPDQYGCLISQQQAKACVYVYDPEDEFKKNNRALKRIIQALLVSPVRKCVRCRSAAGLSAPARIR